MERLQAFQAVARERGFVELNESEDGTVLWLVKDAQGATSEVHQRMCIDSITDSVTIFWMTAPGRLKSKTFRGVPALLEWLELKLEDGLKWRDEQ